MIVWMQLAVCVAVIGFAGVKLSVYGDALAERTGMGRTWIGLLLLATVTSLPELVTGLSSVTVAMVPDIAVGDIFGSCVFNLLIIVLLDFLSRGENVYRRASQGHILSAAFGILLLGTAAFAVMVASQGVVPVIGHVSLSTPVILILYAIAMRTVFRYEMAQLVPPAHAGEQVFPELTTRQIGLRYAMAAALVVAAGVALPFVAEDLAVAMHWEQSFVGTLFVAFATSLPEMVVTVAALRIGALDMAIGNLVGSNLFNVAILAIDDIFYLPGALLSDVSPSHAVSAVSAMIMSGIAIVGLLYRPRTRVLRTVGWASILLLLVYLMNATAVYLFG